MTDHPESRSHSAPAHRQDSPRSRKKPQSPLQQRLRRIRRNRFWLLLFLWMAAVLPELVLHAVSAKSVRGFFNAGLILGPVFALVPALALFILCTLIPRPGVNHFLTVVYSGAMLLLHGFQLVYYRIFGTFCSVRSLTDGAAALQFGSTILTALGGAAGLLLVMGIPFLVVSLWGRVLFSFRALKGWKCHIPMIISCVLVQLLATAALPLFGGKSDTSPYGLYHNSSDSYLSVSRLGLLTAFRLDAQRTLTGHKASGSITLETQPPETTPPPQTSPQAVTEPEESAPVPTVPQANLLDIDFQTLAQAEDNEAVAQIHGYFAGRTASLKNEKTGLFEGCNLILITAEAFSHLAVSEDLTPTLYKMMHEGYLFTDYYVPDWGVSTTDGEYAHLTGTIPKSGEWSFEASIGNYMPLTMAQQLIAKGYSAFAYHGHTYDYYERDRYLENLGYEYKAYGRGLDVTWQWPESDVEVIDLSTGDYVDSEPFTAYYMTISGHREFRFNGNSMAAKNRAAVEQLPYSEPVLAYLACQLELEKSMELLLQRLENAGVLEHTVIVLTADHYPNGLTPEELGELLGHVPESNFELYRNGCIIWKPGMEPEIIDAPTSHLDLLPTLSNLFGLDFDSRLYMGRDVFSSAQPLVMFRNRSWITDLAMYNVETGQVTARTDLPVEQDYVLSVSTEVSNRFAVSARILEYNYWRILFD